MRERERMNINFTFNKLIYNICHDFRIEPIQEVLGCELVGNHGNYYGKYISYLAKGHCNEDKVKELESIIKHHVEIKYDNYSYIIKVYLRDLPSFIPFEYNPSNDIYLGCSYDGKLKLSFSDYTNIIVGGCTGSGKTNLISSIILNLNCKCIYIDNKGGADNPLLNVVECVTNISNGIDKLYDINNTIERRLIQLRNNKNTKLERIVIVLDELYPYTLLPSKERKEVYALIGTMLSRCRVAKVNFILCSQRLTTEIIPSLIMANIDVRICMKVASEQESINCIRRSDAFYIKEKGIGIVNLNGDIKTFKSMFVDDVSNYAKKEHIEDVNIEEENKIEDVIYL